MSLCLSNYVPWHVGHWSPCKVLVPPAMARSASKEGSWFGEKNGLLQPWGCDCKTETLNYQSTSIYQLDIIHSSLSTMPYDRPAFFYHFALRIIVFLYPVHSPHHLHQNLATSNRNTVKPCYAVNPEPISRGEPVANRLPTASPNSWS